MAHEKKHLPADLSNALADTPYAFSFFQAVRFLDCARNQHRTEEVRIGYSQHPEDDPVRFRQRPTLNFPPSEIARFTPGKDFSPAEMTVYFFGLLGCNGPLPLHLTDYICNRKKHYDDNALSNFLDIFHHRMISLFYRAWADCQQVISIEKGNDTFAAYIGSLIGIENVTAGTPELISKQEKLHYAGRLIHSRRNAEGLCAILSDYFDMPVDIDEFVGQWLPLPEDEYFLLGKSPDIGRLGRSTIIGRRVWDCQTKFRLIMGPMDLDKYNQLVPGTDGYRRLNAWISTYVGPLLDWEIQLILKADEVPDMAPGTPVQLGYSTWLRHKDNHTHADNLVIKGSRHYD